MLHFSFLPFYAPTGAWPVEATVGQPLPLVVGEVFALQCPVQAGLPPPQLPLRLDLVRGDPGAGWTIVHDDVLPVEWVAASARLMLNAVPRQPLPALPPGLGHLALRQANDTLWAVSPAVQVTTTVPAATALLRYRNLQPGFFFDYSQPLVFNQVRLPLEVARPQYRLTPLPNYDPVTGLNTPLVQRIDKLWAARTGWLSSIQVEALQIALRHDNTELWVPANSSAVQPGAAGSWQAFALWGEAEIAWAPDAELPVGQTTARLRPYDFSTLNGMFTIPVLPST